MTLNNDPNILFSAQSNGSISPAPKVPVTVHWGNVNLSDFTGPTPFIDISQEMNRGENGTAQSIKYNITLTGKIARLPKVTGETDCPNTRVLNPDDLGIKAILDSASGIQQVFKNCPTEKFEIKCNNTSLYTLSGVRFTNFSLDKSNDNWVRTADFTINLEYDESVPGTEGDNVRDTSDTWSIEPLDDAVYTKFIVPVKQRSEWSNPRMLPTRPSAAGGGGGTVPLGVIGAQGAGVLDLQVINVPQFRITRRLSAKGLPTISGTPGIQCSGDIRPNPNIKPPTYELSYTQAKSWVDKQSLAPFNTAIPSGKPYFTKMPNLLEFTRTFLYNFTRSDNIDVGNATYESTQTWLAMPTGMPYVESYTVEASTSLEMIKTVRVAGNIQGLSFTPFASMVSGYLPTGTGLDAKIDLAGNALLPTSGGTILPYALPDVPNISSTITILDGSRYKNAVSGWLNDIKPYMYRRACLAVNSAERDRDYVPSYTQDPPQPPENPIYAKESMLSVIPVSTSEGHDPKKGTVSYNYEYNNKFNIISGVISENITISNEGPADVVAETQVPGRALGPILAKNGTTATKKTLNIEIVIMPPTGIDGFFVNNPSCPVYTGGYIYRLINKLVEGIKPFGSTAGDVAIFGQYATNKNQQGVVFVSSDSDSWTPTQGRYTRTVSWTYQQCTNSKYYLDH